MKGRTTTTRVQAWRAALGIVALVLLCDGLHAQSILTPPVHENPSYFGSIQIADNLSYSSILAYDGSYECGVFQHGSKWSPSGQLGVSWPEGGGWSLGASLLYTDLSTNYSISANQTPLTPLARDNSGNYVPINRNRLLDVNLGMFGASAFATYEVLPHLAIVAGPFVGLLT